jgi:hypothetical protein
MYRKNLFISKLIKNGIYDSTPDTNIESLNKQFVDIAIENEIEKNNKKFIKSINGKGFNSTINTPKPKLINTTRLIPKSFKNFFSYGI